MGTPMPLYPAIAKHPTVLWPTVATQTESLPSACVKGDGRRASSLEPRHDFLGEQLHRLELFALGQPTEREVAAEVAHPRVV